MELEQSFLNIKDWLKFAEAKNAALVGLVGVLMPTYINLAGDDAVLAYAYGFTAIPFLVISSFLALISFLPRLDFLPEFLVRQDGRALGSESDLFFEHIARRGRGEALERMRMAFNFDESDRLKCDIGEQIFALSQITRRKMLLFSWALRFLIVGIFTPAAALAMLIIFKNDIRSTD